MNEKPLTVRLAEAFGSKPVPPRDDLERRLCSAFGEEAARIELRAQRESGVVPVEAVDRVLDLGERWKA